MSIADRLAIQQRLQSATSDQLTVGEPIGQGGFAIVFRARDDKLQRDVAIKVLDPDLATAQAMAERFLREARTIASLEHPNIVPVHAVAEHDGLLFIVMRFIDGPSLADVLRDRGALPPEEATDIGVQIADALSHAHQQGIIHRDIKPENILIDPAGRVVVTDFGIAKVVEDAGGLTQEGTVIGSPRYMSPEQAAGESVDGRTDLYSLGLLLYEMLTGSCPFDGPTAAAILAKQLTQQPPPLESPDHKLPEPLVSLVMKALQKDPDERFQTGEEVRNALRAIQTGPVRDRPRSRTMAGIFAALLIVTVIGGLGLLNSVAFGGTPAIDALGNFIPDSSVAALQAMGAIQAGESVLYMFAPKGQTLMNSFVITDSRLVRVTPTGIRAHQRDDVIGLGWATGPWYRGSAIFVFTRTNPDTLFHRLSRPERDILHSKLQAFGYLRSQP